MRTSSQIRQQKVVCELQHRLAALRERKLNELLTLPEEETQETEIEGHRVLFTTFREPQPDGSVLITVRSDIPAVFGIVTMGTTDGFLVMKNGEKKDAPEKLLKEY